MKINEKIINIATNEETIIERDLTADELENRVSVETIIENNKIVLAKIEVEKIALLEKLGITADEAKLLLL